MLQVDSISVRYGKNKRKAVDGANLSIEGGKVAIVGPNGCGKTTLIKAIVGLAPVESGSILLFGRNIKNITNELRVSTNLSDVYRLMRMSTGDTIKLYSEIKRIDADVVMKMISDFELEDTLDKMLYELSTGQQKLVCNLLCIATGSKMILLDEPFENIDQMRRIKLTKLMVDYQSEILLNTHEFDILGKLNGWSLYFMLEGKLFGKFEANDVRNLFLNRGISPNNLSVMETSYGTFSITRGEGEVSISAARNFNSLLNEVA